MTLRPPEQLTDPRTGDTLLLRRSWPRAAGHVLLEYALADAGGSHPGGPHPGDTVAGQWYADAAALARSAAATPAPALVVAGTGVLLQPEGADRRLRVLSEVLAAPGTTLLVHRPERRAVVRRTGTGTVTYVKVVRPGRSAAVAAAAERVATGAGEAFVVPRLLEHDEERGLLVWSELPGRTLEDIGGDPTVSLTEFVDGWRAAGVAVAAMHGAPVDSRSCSSHDAAAEIGVTRRWVHAAVGYGLLPGEPARAALAAVDAGLSADAPGPVGLLHRDLHDKQLLLADGRAPGILDADTSTVGERALDVANLLVHLELRCAQGGLPADRFTAARVALLDGLAPEPAALARVPAYARATRLRLAAVYAFRPRWRTVASRFLDAAAAP